MPANTSGLTLCRGVGTRREKRPIDPVRFARHPEASSTIGASFFVIHPYLAEMP